MPLCSSEDSAEPKIKINKNLKDKVYLLLFYLKAVFMEPKLKTCSMKKNLLTKRQAREKKIFANHISYQELVHRI